MQSYSIANLKVATKHGAKGKLNIYEIETYESSTHASRPNSLRVHAYIMNNCHHARSQKSVMRGDCCGSLGAEPPALENFVFFGKNNLLLSLFCQKLMLWNVAQKLAVQKYNCTSCINGLCGR